ncbi:MAG: hypothetical protein O7D30_07545, partial [Rickettsia endosymbiont of Ixodes persulcatus]|nr:hypothetical protein [Rickettsia endosymbiont of Ixodes persulcatus]
LTFSSWVSRAGEKSPGFLPRVNTPLGTFWSTLVSVFATFSDGGTAIWMIGFTTKVLAYNFLA